MAITIDDFDKIWASTSPLTPYDFTETNYKEGWNFVGSTPPARQMWDSIQKQNDEKTQWLYNNKVTGTETTEAFTISSIAGSGTANVSLSHKAKYYSVFLAGVGYPFLVVTMQNDRQTINIYNTTGTTRTNIGLTVRYIY